MGTTGVARVRHVADGVEWHLVARNGRVIARSPGAASTTTAAVDALREACRLAAAEGLVPQLRHPRSSVAWTWTAVGSTGDPMACGLRVYERYGTCLSAYQRFVRTAAEWDAAGDWDLTGAGPFCSSVATDLGASSPAGELCP